MAQQPFGMAGNLGDILKLDNKQYEFSHVMPVFS
jgi:hypothetical protein